MMQPIYIPEPERDPFWVRAAHVLFDTIGGSALIVGIPAGVCFLLLVLGIK